MYRFDNEGQRLLATNYWDSEAAQAGYCFLSWNAGAARLLLPDSRKAEWLPEMRSAKEVLVSRGPWTDQGGRQALELLFGDGTDSPFCIHLVAEQCDRLIPETDQGSGFVVAVWTRGGVKLRLPGRYRVVDKIPCLLPWIEQ